MEIYSNSTRFALACNTSAKIIEPIQSRCAIVRFSRLSDQEILGRLMVVVEAEKVKLLLRTYRGYFCHETKLASVQSHVLVFRTLSLHSVVFTPLVVPQVHNHFITFWTYGRWTNNLLGYVEETGTFLWLKAQALIGYNA